MTEIIQTLDDAPSLLRPIYWRCLWEHSWRLRWGFPTKGPDGETDWHIDECSRGCRRTRWWKCPCPYHEEMSV